MNFRLLNQRVLKPAEVGGRHDGDLASLGQPLVQQAIRILVLSAGQVVPTSRLFDLLWVEPEEADVLRLRTLMNEVRTVVGQERLGGNDRQGYVLTLESTDSVDIIDFRECMREAHETDDTTTAVSLLKAAVDLWTDVSLSGFPKTVSAQAIVRTMKEELWSARQSLADGWLALGEYDEMITATTRWLTEDPVYETLWARLMVAMFRSGRPAQAVRTFADAEAALKRSVGIRPGPMLRRIQELITAGIDPAAELPPVWAPAETRYRDSPRPIAQLPPDIGDFTGRTREFGRLRQWLVPAKSSHAMPIVQLVGPPGVGKSALAVHVAHAISSNFPDGQLFVNLAGDSTAPHDPGAVLVHILRSMGVLAADIPDGTADRAAFYRSMLSGQRLLLIADAASGPEQVRPLLPGTAGCAVMITSRTQSSYIAGGHLLQLETMPGREAKEMLSRIVGTERVDNESAAAEEVVEACGRLPLAVRIAGARLAARPSWRLRDLANSLADHRGRLNNLTIGDMAIRTSFSLSYDLLPADASRAFRLLPLIGPHPFAEWAVAAVTGLYDAADIVDTLIDKSLITDRGVDSAGQPRFEVHDLLLDYATELAQSPTTQEETEVGIVQLILCVIELCDLADSRIPREPHAPPPHRRNEWHFSSKRTRKIVETAPEEWFREERAVLLQIAHSACAAGRFRISYALALRLSAYLHLDGHFDDEQTLWRAIGEAAGREGDEGLVAETKFRDAVVIGAARGRCTEAIPILDECVEVFTEHGDKRALARTLALRAWCAQTLDRIQGAHDDASRGLRLSREIRDQYAECSCLRTLGVILGRMGNHEQAIKCCADAVGIAQHLEEPIYSGRAKRELVQVYLWALRYDDALELARQGLADAKALGYRSGIANFTEQIGEALHGQGAYDEAFRALGRAVAMFDQLGLEQLAASCRLKLAAAGKAAGHIDEAVATLRRCIDSFRRLKLPEDEGRARNMLSECDGLNTDLQ